MIVLAIVLALLVGFCAGLVFALYFVSKGRY
jgi:uncharacterized membrane protein YqaE (UPF0057 family)